MAASVMISSNLSYVEYAMILGAALIHELGHLAAARLLKIRIKCINLAITGAIIETDSLLCSYSKEAVLCLAGPFMNALSVAALSAFPVPIDLRLFKISSIFFAAINLLPAKCFDGGRALSCLLMSKIRPSSVSVLLEISSFICVFFLWAVSIYFIMRTGSYLSLFVFSGSLFAKLFLLPESKS